ncbi:MAG: hypothetical protein CME62_07325 [Halobacteriovoraceae bacterium]|nr:hypothetical protein [Halobacteriovoraceae bacterium]|tara:strand:+ start:45802 stop:46746 length:945 start_codon:yes stop_codon:yes gene_type:complete
MSDNSLIYNRLRKNFKQLNKQLKKHNFNAYRLYEKDIPEYPYIVDVYDNKAVIYEKGKKLDFSDTEQRQRHKSHALNIKSALIDLLNITPDNIILKARTIKKGKSQYEKLAEKEQFFTVHEGEMKFRVNLTNYLDSGLFLDHRPLREIIRQQSQNKKVLNLFAYTGSLSVAAALGGGEVTTVDLSNTYIDWAQENFKLNQIKLDDHKFRKADALNFIKNLNLKYDLIILDPPSFSNSKSMEDNFNVQDDHVWMIEKLMSCLNKGGELYFSNNLTKFKISEELKEKFKVEDITYKTIPPEFRNKKIHQCFKITNP